MNKDKKLWSVIMIPLSVAEDEDVVGRAVKQTADNLLHGLLDKLSDGKEYAVKMIPPQTIPNIERGTTEIRTAMSMREIVRCKYCKHRFTSGCTMRFDYVPFNDDWFCADGEPKGVIEN